MSDVRDVGALTQVWPLRPAGEEREKKPPPARRPRAPERPARQDDEAPARDGGIDEYV